MLTISADIASMSHGQREALCGFIRSYPVVDSLGMLVPDVTPEIAEPLPFAVLPAASAEPAATLNAAVPMVDFALRPTSPTTLDKSGLPWDERIHSSSKNFTGDGNWRKKRGVDEALVAQVEAQLKALMALPSPAAVASVPPPPGPTLVPAPPVPVDLTIGKDAFVKLVKRVSESIQAGKLAQVEVTAVCEKHGIAALNLLPNRFDLVPVVALDIEQIIVTRG